MFDPAFYEAWVYIPVLLLATALSALSNFAGSVYMVERRGVATMVTSLIGALLNIGLNLWLIPAMGPMGAAIATLASYFVVLVVRTLHARHLIRFRLPPVWLLLNAILLGALGAIVTLAVRGWVWYAIALCLALAVIDAPYLIRSAIHLLRRRKNS